MAKKMRSFGGKSLRPAGEKKPNMNELLAKATKAQEEMEKFEEKFGERIFEVSAGGGVVKVEIFGNGKIKDFIYDEELMEDKEEFKDILLAAINEAIETVKTEKERQMNEISGNFGIPDMGNLGL